MHHSEIEYAGLQAFIEFFEHYGIEFWQIEAMKRMPNGKHEGAICQHMFYYHPTKKTETGDPLKVYPYAGPIGSRKLNYTLRRLQSSLLSRGRFGFDLYIKASPRGTMYYRTILIDDLKQSKIDELMNYYKGPIAIIETSPGNYQAILIITDEFGLSRPKRLNVGKQFAALFDGDYRAVSGNQLHRFPGSPNMKKSVSKDPEKCEPPFHARLIQLRHLIDADAESQTLRSLAVLPPPPRPGVAATLTAKTTPATRPTPGPAGGLTWSEKAFRWTLRMIKKGATDQQLAAGLHALFVVPHPQKKHTGDGHWIPRTIFNARAVSTGSPLRYSV